MARRGAPEVSGAISILRADGGQLLINVDPHRLPLPTRWIAANWVGAYSRGDRFELLFGHAFPGTERLSAALVVSLAKKHLQDALCQANFVERIKRRNGSKPLSSLHREPPLGPSDDRFVFERANVLGAIYSEFEAEMVFFQASGSALERLKRGTPGHDELVEPIVGVRMEPGLLIEIINFVCEEAPHVEE